MRPPSLLLAALLSWLVALLQLRVLAMAAAEVDDCALSFADFDSALPLLQFRTVAHRCPPQCLSLLSTSASPSQLFGSYPYHSSSSICLAAIHCGLLNSTVGGSVFVSRFYRSDWTATASIFPNASASASLSNGVRSQEVPLAWNPQPASSDDWAYTVRGRGEWAVQRRPAPWSGRSGHLHATLSAPSNRVVAGDALLEVQLIVGGYDGVGYLNDVWLSSRANISSPHISDIRWQRLPDAPFSPRAVMTYWAYLTATDFRVVILGGQTGHLCGLAALGVCGNDVWEAALERRSVQLPRMRQLTEVTGLRWILSNTTLHAPFAPRCGATMLPIGTTTVALVGGQLSAHSCHTAPQAVNDVWAHRVSITADVTAWTAAAAAPFTGRRSMRLDNSLTLYTPEARVDTITQLAALLGGLAYLNVSHNSTSDTATLSRAQLWSEVWLCSPVTRPSPSPAECSWLPLQADGRSCPAAFAPLPTADGASSSLRYPANLIGLRFGGVDSAPAMDDWSPSANISSFARLFPLDDGVRCEDVEDASMGLPRSVVVEAAELNAPDGSWSRGSGWVQAHSPWRVRLAERPPTERFVQAHSSVHYQSHSLAASPAQSSWALPQPLSAANSTRPLFRFPFRRLGHASTAWSSALDMREWTDLQDSRSLTPLPYNFTFGQLIVSGGHSGSLYSNDWISLTEPRCLAPDDPSFLQALGSMRIRRAGPEEDLIAHCYVQEALLEVDCSDGNHWEPSSVEPVTVFCAANGLWLDSRLLSIRRCEADRLHCSFPAQERDGACSPPVPIITAVRVSDARNASALTAMDVPMEGSTLTILGRFFAPEVEVQVGGHPCIFATLLEAEAAPRMFNVSFPPHTSLTPFEQLLHSRVECTLPFLFGFNLPVTVFSGVARLQAQTIDGSVATLSSAAPKMNALIPTLLPDGSESCRWSATAPLTLTDCSIFRAFDVYVCVDQRTFRGQQATVWLASAIQMRCDPFVDFAYAYNVSFDSNSSHAAFLASLTTCTRCRLLPSLGSPLSVSVRHPDLALESAEVASVSFEACTAGFHINANALLNQSRADYYQHHAPICQPCPRGTTSGVGTELGTCDLCQPGTFSLTEASPSCSQCAPGTYSNESGALTCPQCSRNSFQRRWSADSCVRCDGDRYLRVPPENSGSLNGTAAWAVYGQCGTCPEVADCDADGTIRARPQLFLTIDQAEGSFSYATCPATACLAGAQCQGDPAPVISSSQLPVLNCCGPGRRPAYDPHDAALTATDGVNVLCALCMDGYAEVNGRCVWCPATRWGSVVPLLLLVLAVTFLLHRLPHNGQTSALMTVGGYFVQQSALMLAALPIPQLFSLFNLNVLGDHNRYDAAPTTFDTLNTTVAEPSNAACVAPLSDSGKLTVALLSPLLFAAALVLVAAAQLTARALLRHFSSSKGGSPSPRAWSVRVYCRVFMAPPPRVINAVHASMGLGPSVANAEQPPLPSWYAFSGQLMPLQYQRTAVRLLLLSYTSLSLTSLLFFRYQRVGVYGKRLVDYRQIDPSSDEYLSLLPGVLVVLVLVVAGLPLAVSLFLWLQRQKRSKELQAEGSDEATQSRALLSLEAQLRGVFPSAYWWMTPFILLRRLVTVLVLLLATRSSTWVWMSAVHFSLLAVHLRLTPFSRPVDNDCETVTLSALALQAVVLSLEPPPSTGVAAQVVLGLLATGPLLLLSAVFVWDVWTRRRIRLQRRLNEEAQRLQAQSVLFPDDRSRLDEPLLRGDHPTRLKQSLGPPDASG